MRSHVRARSARSAMVAVVAALALGTGGLAYGASVAGDGSSTTGVQTEDAAPPGTAPAGGTANMQAPPGAQPSNTIPQGSTTGMLPGAAPAVEAPAATDVDKSDRGKKGAKATKDEGKKNAPVTTG